MKITIEGRLPSLNDVIDENRKNKFAGAKLKKQIQHDLVIQIISQCKKKYEKVKIAIAWYEPNRKRDMDNIASSKKFILDALVTAGVIPNDGWKNIYPEMIDTFLVDKENPRIEVVLLEV